MRLKEKYDNEKQQKQSWHRPKLYQENEERVQLDSTGDSRLQDIKDQWENLQLCKIKKHRETASFNMKWSKKLIQFTALQKYIWNGSCNRSRWINEIDNQQRILDGTRTHPLGW